MLKSLDFDFWSLDLKDFLLDFWEVFEFLSWAGLSTLFSITNIIARKVCTREEKSRRSDDFFVSLVVSDYSTIT